MEDNIVGNRLATGENGTTRQFLSTSLARIFHLGKSLDAGGLGNGRERSCPLRQRQGTILRTGFGAPPQLKPSLEIIDALVLPIDKQPSFPALVKIVLALPSAKM